MGCGQDKIEAGTLVLVAMRRNETVVPFNDLFRYGKAYSCALESIFWMQPLEQFKYIFGAFFFETNAVVRDAKPVKCSGRIGRGGKAFFADSRCFQVYNGWVTRMGEFQGIAEQVMQYLAELSGDKVDLG